MTHARLIHPSLPVRHTRHMSTDLRGELALREASLTASLADPGTEESGRRRHWLSNYATLLPISQDPTLYSYRISWQTLLAFVPMADNAVRQRLVEFIDSLYELGGFASWGEFARESGLLSSTVSDYHRGENAPSGPNLLRLIEAATTRSSLSMHEAAARQAPIAQILFHLESLEEKLDEALAGIGDVLLLLREEPPESDVGAPRATP